MKCKECKLDKPTYTKDTCKRCYQINWYKNNKENVKQKAKQAYLENREENIARVKRWKAANPEKVKVIDKNRDKQKDAEYFKNKYKTDLNYRIKVILRNRLRCAIKNNQKAGSAIKDLGCSIEEFKTYIEAKFQPDMSWDNHGLKTWHLDHIVPLDKFDLTNPEEFKKACHYTNIQPMYATENLRKSCEG